ncbi:MAG: DUF1918 domain-containing protein [Ilumatobacter sp.]|uniref:DUF1918 domain-containing protein n=1 Tax=Ilumatobacter sp. TaxID=1967498 RepID=UPI0032998708
MRAQPGDKLVISGHQVGEPKRIGMIKEVRGDDGGPPYRVEWDADGHTTLLYPGPDCTIEAIGHHAAVGAGR